MCLKYMDFAKLDFGVQKQNGRVTYVTDNPVKDFPMYVDGDQCLESYQSRLLEGIVEKTPLSNAFFSSLNIARLQNLIRYRVFKESGLIIGKQSETDLVIIMRATYLQNGRNDPTMSIASQVATLNHIVGNYAVPNITSKAQQYLGYIQDIEQNPVPITHPVNVSNAGTRTLRSVTSTF